MKASNMKKRLFISPCNEKRTEFLQSLQIDLNRIGHDMEFIEQENDIEIHFEPFDYESASDEEVKALMRSAFEELKKIKLNKESTKKFILKMEDGVIQNLIAKGSEVDIEKIKPEVRICESKEDKDIFRYFRYYQSVPNSPGVGRRFSAIIYDVGQKTERIIGIIGLQGAAYSSSSRDEYLKWSNIDSRAEEKRKKELGLRRTMQLAILTAIPPYNYLFGSKLAALLSLSNPIQEYFSDRYKTPLLAVFTTCAYGLHAAMYNRIQLRKIPSNDHYSYYDNELFERIGETNLFSQIMLSDKTAEIAKNMFSNLPNERQGLSFRTPLSKSRSISKALSVCGLNKKVLYMYPMGVYIGCLHENNLNILRNGSESINDAILDLDVDDVRKYWFSEVLNKKINSQNETLLKNHDVQSIMLSNYLEKD
ncbi:MAG TPA: hypothetical protein DCL08_04855 [Anaerolineaceae bacterium]|nr:hypothetical protein [Anaerolineaceae bacterium]